jgi:fructokinase
MFIVCGEALFDVFATGSTPTGLGFDGRIGGSPFNVALGLARLAQPVGFFGGIGTGFAGDRLMQALADEGIDARCHAAHRRAHHPQPDRAWMRVACPATRSMARAVPTGCCGPEHLAAIPPEARCLPLRQLCHGGAAGGRHPACAGRARAPAQRDQPTTPTSALNVEPDLDVWRATLQWMLPRTAPAEGERRRPGPAAAGPVDRPVCRRRAGRR